MTPTQELMAEHRVIEKMLAIAVKAADRLENGEELDQNLYPGATDFFRNFADKCHHAKEEQLLFERLKQRGLSAKTGPLSIMYSEHEQGRAHVRALSERADKPLDASTRKELVEHSRAYADLLYAHIAKEDKILYPLANNILTAVDQMDLQRGFDDIEEKVMGPGVHEKYHKMIEDFEGLLR